MEDRQTLPDNMGPPPSAPADRYRVAHMTSDVFLGLMAVVKRAISGRRCALNATRACFDGQ